MGKTTTKIIGMPWNFASLWNEALRSVPTRAMVKRDYIWASELGGDFPSRYLKMHAHPFSNPHNDRSLMKFSAGYIWEWIVGFILSATGVIQAKQMRGNVELPGLLRVSGKLDFVAGGDIDWVAARERMKQIQKMFAVSIDDMPPIIAHAGSIILNRFEMMFTRVPLRKYILEIKSCSSFMSDRLEKTGKAMPHHVFQESHYLIANPDIKSGLLIYICKDTSYISQFEIELSKPLLKMYSDDVSKMTEYYNNSGKNYLKNIPEKSPEIQFVDGDFRFVKNFSVEYSPYLNFLYGFKNIEEFNNKWKRQLGQWNRVFKKCVLGLDLSKANKIVIQDAVNHFPEFDKYVQKAKKAGAFEKLEEGEDE